MIYGNYTKDVSLLGTMGQVATGLVGLDLPGDIRDILYDVTNWKNTPGHIGQTVLDGIGILPLVGLLKYSDETGLVVKNSVKNVNNLIEGATKTEKWVDDAGNIIWPKNDGFAGKPTEVTLKPGTTIDRYGYETGTFVSPQGTPYEMSSLAPGTELKPYHSYEVIKPIDGLGGKIASWFGQPGGGTQYKLNNSIQELIDMGYLREIK